MLLSLDIPYFYYNFLIKIKDIPNNSGFDLSNRFNLEKKKKEEIFYFLLLLFSRLPLNLSLYIFNFKHS